MIVHPYSLSYSKMNILSALNINKILKIELQYDMSVRHMSVQQIICLTDKSYDADFL